MFDLAHIGLGFLEGGDAAVTAHIAFPSIIGRQDMVQGREFAFQVRQEAGAAEDVFPGIKRIADFQISSGFWHQLHQSLGADTGYGLRVEQGFGMDHGLYQSRIHPVLACRQGDQIVVAVPLCITQGAGLVIPAFADG